MKPIRYKEKMVEEFLQDGHWTDELFSDFYNRNAKEMPDQEALVDSKYRVTWAEAKKLVDAMAISWVEMGIPKSARVIVQSPNSVYGFLARVACERAGLISLTVYPYLRQRELEYMLEKTEATAVVIPNIYRNFNYLEMYRDLQKRFTHLKYFFLFDDEVPADAPEGTSSLTQLVEKRLEKPVDESVLDERRLDAKWDVALLTTTSGTTGIPKLVEWPTAPRVCTSKGRVGIWNLNKDDITMAIAPHAGGAAGTLTYFAAPIAGAKTVMLEEFTPEGALELIEKEKPRPSAWSPLIWCACWKRTTKNTTSVPSGLSVQRADTSRHRWRKKQSWPLAQASPATWERRTRDPSPGAAWRILKNCGVEPSVGCFRGIRCDLWTKRANRYPMENRESFISGGPMLRPDTTEMKN